LVSLNKTNTIIRKENKMNLYDITIKDNKNNDISLKTYQGKVLLIVNTATGCGFTPQYTELQNLYDKYNNEGFVVLDFPCNQFANQAPGDDKAIDSFCTLNYATTFPRFAKIDVNGENESILYTYLKKEKKGLLGSNIKWNFTKFLVNREGKVINRYGSSINPSKIEKDIVALLK